VNGATRAVTALIDRHVSDREDLSRQLWGLMSFALWQEGLAAGSKPHS
jgi:hypothetical protein